MQWLVTLFGLLIGAPFAFHFYFDFSDTTYTSEPVVYTQSPENSSGSREFGSRPNNDSVEGLIGKSIRPDQGYASPPAAGIHGVIGDPID